MTLGNTNESIKILALSRNQNHIYAPLHAVALDQEAISVVETDNWTSDEIVTNQPDILLTATSSSYEAVSCIEAATKIGIPSLLLVDGILEWRNEWENPRFGFGGKLLHDHPIATDKVACLGWRSLLTFETWGNLGKCELIGSPRFDQYITQEPVIRDVHNPRRLLVATANTPGFTDQQRAAVETSLLDLARVLDQRPEWDIIWRVTKGLDTKLNLKNKYPDLNRMPIYRVLREVDAVISTPSTVLLEAMLSGLPTAILDYTNSPQYVQAAWTATSKEHLVQVIDGLYQPDMKRMLFQDEILYTNLECRTPALPRLMTLIREMVRISREVKGTSQKPIYPYQIVPTTIPFGNPSVNMNFSELYPDHPIFARKDVTALQLELIYARQELELLKKLVRTRSIGYWISKMGSALHGIYKRLLKNIVK